MLQDSSPHRQGRIVGAGIGLLLATLGYSLVVLKCWAHRSHLHNVYGLQGGGDLWHIATLCWGLFLGALGTVIFFKASMGRWTWAKK